jgi:hypothetical protein
MLFYMIKQIQLNSNKFICFYLNESKHSTKKNSKTNLFWSIVFSKIEQSDK